MGDERVYPVLTILGHLRLSLPDSALHCRIVLTFISLNRMLQPKCLLDGPTVSHTLHTSLSNLCNFLKLTTHDLPCVGKWEGERENRQRFNFSMFHSLTHPLMSHSFLKIRSSDSMEEQTGCVLSVLPAPVFNVTSQNMINIYVPAGATIARAVTMSCVWARAFPNSSPLQISSYQTLHNMI